MQDISDYKVNTKRKFKLNKIKTDGIGVYKGQANGREMAGVEVAKLIEQTAKLGERLYAEGKQSLLLVLQAMDAGGKDGVIKQVMSGVNPQSCRVTSFKAPSAEERAHDFLWRVHKEVPPKGYIGIFNRSHYEDILWPRVHGNLTDKELKRRVEQILNFEEMLSDTGTTIVKVYLHTSKAEQRKRLQLRVDNPDKRWKFNPADVEERELWSTYMTVYEEVLSRTSTNFAPWYVIPADYKWYRDYVVATLVRDTLKGMKPKYPATAAGIDFATIKID